MPTYFSYQCSSPPHWCGNLDLQARPGSLLCHMEGAGEEPCTRSAAHMSPSYKRYTKPVLIIMKNTANKIRSKCLPSPHKFSMGLRRRESRDPWKPCLTSHSLSDSILTACSQLLFLTQYTLLPQSYCTSCICLS